MATVAWAHRDVKRHLSVYEKSSLSEYHTGGRALVLPGAPFTEVDELVAAGYKPECVHGIESDPDISEQLYDHYWDVSPMHYGEIGQWLSQARGKFSYIHFDYMGHLKEAELASIQGALGKLAPICRVRVSTVRDRRRDTQADFEEVLRRNLLVPLLRQAAHSDHDGRRIWHEAIDLIETAVDDTSQIAAIVVVLNHFFGLSVWNYTDSIAGIDNPPLPEVVGTHCISDIRRFSYYESDSPTRMFTTWVDLTPRTNTGVRYGEWILEEIAKIARLVSVPISNFNPEHYQGD